MFAATASEEAAEILSEFRDFDAFLKLQEIGDLSVARLRPNAVGNSRRVVLATTVL